MSVVAATPDTAKITAKCVGTHGFQKMRKTVEREQQEQLEQRAAVALKTEW